MANNTDWLNISQMTGGTGETALSLTALTNTSLQPKTATITARNTQYNVSDTTTVTIQGFQPTLTLSRSTLRFDSTGGTATFTVYSNTSWTIQFPPIVQSYSVSAGTGNMEVSVVLAPNPDEVAKVDTGLVKDIYNVNQLYLTIVQESFIVELSVEPDDDITFANTGSSTSITVDCNTDWELYYPSWVTPSVTSGSSGTTTVTFTAPENGQTDRSGQITVYAGSKEVTLDVFQPFYIPPYITVTPSAWTFNYTEDGKTFVVDSYPEWTAEVISTGETVWSSEVYMEATFVIPSAMTMRLFYLLPTGTDIYFGPVKQLSSSITFDTPGTYKIRYEMPSGGTAPSLRGNTYLTDLYFTDGIGALSEGAFSGCSSLSGIITDCITAPSICAHTFYGVATGGTLIYPAGSDYQKWLRPFPYCLGYYDWPGFTGKTYMLVEYNVTSTTKPTRILNETDEDYNMQLFSAITLENGEAITPAPGAQPDYGYTYTFSETGRTILKYYPVSESLGTSFEKCPQIVSVELSDLTTEVGCFDGLWRLSSITLNNIVTAVSFNTVGLTSLTLPNSVVSCNVVYCSGITSLSLPDSVVSCKMLECPNLVTVRLSNNLTSLSNNCFAGCESLTGITLPPSIQTIGAACFGGCSSLETITSYSTTAPTISSNTFANVKTGGVLYYPTGSDYSSWLSTSDYYLGKYGWTGQEI